MRAVRTMPSAALRPHVRAILEVPSAAGDTSRLLPESGVVVGFRIGGAASSIEDGGARRLASAGVTGLRNTLRKMWMPEPGLTVVAALRPLGASRLFAVPLHELFGAIVPLDALVPAPEVRATEARMLEAPDAAARAAVLDAFLAQRLRGDEDALVRAAIARITSSRGSVRIGALARELGTSQDPLEKRFRRRVGASPKQYASIVRFRRAVRESASRTTLTQLAHASGYFDQAHMAREFRAVTGEPPSQFLRRDDRCVLADET